MDAAREFLLDYLPGIEPVWIGGDIHASRRLDSFVVEDRSGESFHHVLSILIDGIFVPDVVSTCPHVPYDTASIDARPPRENEIGAFVTLEDIYSPSATHLRMAVGLEMREAPVIADHATLFDWDTPWIQCRAVPVALRIGGAWVPTVSRAVAATAADFRDGYIAFMASDRRGDDWAPSSFYDAETFGERLAMVEAVLAGDELSAFCHGCLAAGPVEDLISVALLDYIDAGDADRRARWIALLHETYWHHEPPEIQARLHVLLGVGSKGAR